jgi:hypothetical protein
MDHKKCTEKIGQGFSCIQILLLTETFLWNQVTDEITLCKLEVRDYWRNIADGFGITDQKIVAVHGSPTPLILILANQSHPPPQKKN